MSDFDCKGFKKDQKHSNRIKKIPKKTPNNFKRI